MKITQLPFVKKIITSSLITLLSTAAIVHAKDEPLDGAPSLDLEVADSQINTTYTENSQKIKDSSKAQTENNELPNSSENSEVKDVILNTPPKTSSKPKKSKRTSILSEKQQLTNSFTDDTLTGDTSSSANTSIDTQVINDKDKKANQDAKSNNDENVAAIEELNIEENIKKETKSTQDKQSNQDKKVANKNTKNNKIDNTNQAEIAKSQTKDLENINTKPDDLQNNTSSLDKKTQNNNDSLNDDQKSLSQNTLLKEKKQTNQKKEPQKEIQIDNNKEQNVINSQTLESNISHDSKNNDDKASQSTINKDTSTKSNTPSDKQNLDKSSNLSIEDDKTHDNSKDNIKPKAQVELNNNIEQSENSDKLDKLTDIEKKAANTSKNNKNNASNNQVKNTQQDNKTNLEEVFADKNKNIQNKTTQNNKIEESTDALTKDSTLDTIVKDGTKAQGKSNNTQKNEAELEDLTKSEHRNLNKTEQSEKNKSNEHIQNNEFVDTKKSNEDDKKLSENASLSTLDSIADSEQIKESQTKINKDIKEKRTATLLDKKEDFNKQDSKTSEKDLEKLDLSLTDESNKDDIKIDDEHTVQKPKLKNLSEDLKDKVSAISQEQKIDDNKNTAPIADDDIKNSNEVASSQNNTKNIETTLKTSDEDAKEITTTQINVDTKTKSSNSKEIEANSSASKTSTNKQNISRSSVDNQKETISSTFETNAQNTKSINPIQTNLLNKDKKLTKGLYTTNYLKHMYLPYFNSEYELPQDLTPYGKLLTVKVLKKAPVLVYYIEVPDNVGPLDLDSKAHENRLINTICKITLGEAILHRLKNVKLKFFHQSENFFTRNLQMPDCTGEKGYLFEKKLHKKEQDRLDNEFIFAFESENSELLSDEYLATKFVPYALERISEKFTTFEQNAQMIHQENNAIIIEFNVSSTENLKLDKLANDRIARTCQIPTYSKFILPRIKSLTYKYIDKDNKLLKEVKLDQNTCSLEKNLQK